MIKDLKFKIYIIRNYKNYKKNEIKRKFHFTINRVELLMELMK